MERHKPVSLKRVNKEPLFICCQLDMMALWWTARVVQSPHAERSDTVLGRGLRFRFVPLENLAMCQVWVGDQALVQIGQPAPDFACTAVVDGKLKEVSLSGYTEASHWVLLLFFPKAWSPVCPTEIKAFSDRLEEFLYSRACALLFASTDNLDSLRAWNNTGIMEGGLGGVHMPLISDTNHRLSRAYGVLNEEMGLANRAFFLIDPTGTIRAISSNDAYVARNVSEVLRLLDALIFKDEYGEGCPADWQKGDQGIDIEKDKVEGALEVKKSFAKWLRPKLERAISSTSQFGTTQLERVTSNTPANHCHHNSNGSGPRNIGSVTSKRNSVSTDTVTITDKRPSNPNERTNSNERVQTATSRFSASAQSSGQVSPVVGQMSPMANPRSADYFASKPNASRLEVYMEEATLHQRMENMNAALENYKQSQTVGSVG